VQPFIAIGQELAKDGHRVRVATHVTLREVVESKGLEFYPLGGDPFKLAEFAVRNKGSTSPSVARTTEEVH
jgi:sterol 3beta-glucosyltransferase